MSGDSFEAHPDPVAALAESRRAALARVAVPTLVALVDARPEEDVVVTDERSRRDGAALAGLFDHYQQVVAAAGRNEQLDEEELAYTGAGELIETLAVLGQLHVRIPVGSGDRRDDPLELAGSGAAS